MSGRGSNKRGSKRENTAAAGNGCESTLLSSGLAVKEKFLEIFVIAAILAFGIYHSVLYYGHQPVPHFDANCFSGLGHRILSLQIPDNFKRAPLVGVLQVLLGHIAGGRSPDFTGGWLLNALLHPLNAVLFWLVGRRIIGKAALWIAIIAIINPWVLQLLTEAIVETTLLFCVLATFYFIFRRSNYCYLFASITTMVRYEGAALILAAFVMDMIRREGKKERIRAFVYSAIASVPLALWMLLTVLNWQSQGTTHYLKELGSMGAFKDTFVKYLVLVWRVGFYPLLVPPPVSTKSTFDIFFYISQILVAGSFIFGSLYGLCKRQWNILALLIFFIPYFLIHVMHSFVFSRFCMPVFWIPLLICFYGMMSLWKLINKNDRVPKPIVLILQAAVLVIGIFWVGLLLPYLPKMAAMSRRSVLLPYVAMGVICLVLGARAFVYRAGYLWRDIVISVLAVLAIVSNQFVLVRVVGNGERDIEFKYVVDWYLANAKPGEKLVSTVPVILETMAPEHKDYFVHTYRIGGNNPTEFVQGCYKQNITYVTWDSRMGFSPNNRYYKFWNMKNIAPLGLGRDIGPYEFICRVGNKRRYVNIFRLHRPNTQTKHKP